MSLKAIKMNKKFKSSWPSFTPEEIRSVSSILKSGKINYWTGKYCKIFEKISLNTIKLNIALLLIAAQVLWSVQLNL